jgi:hypothetical protein
MNVTLKEEVSAKRRAMAAGTGTLDMLRAQILNTSFVQAMPTAAKCECCIRWMPNFTAAAATAGLAFGKQKQQV